MRLAWNCTRRGTSSTRWVAKAKEYSALVLAAPLALAYVTLMLPVFLIKAYNTSDFHKHRKDKREDRRGRKPPPVVERQRALSHSAIEVDCGHHQEARQSSILCALPAEIRILIFEHLIGKREKLHIIYDKGSLKCYRCLVSNSPGTPPSHDPCREIWKNQADRHQGSTTRFGVLPYLQCSRNLYHENINSLYALPQFLFEDYTSFIAFSASLLPRRFNAIQHVSFFSCSTYFATPHDLLDNITCADGIFANPHSRTTYYNIENNIANYHALHRHDFKMRCPILPSLPPAVSMREKAVLVLDERNRWAQIRKILRLMASLREVEVQVCIGLWEGPAGFSGEDYTSSGFRGVAKEMSRIWPAPDEQWSDFEVERDVYTEGRYWFGANLATRRL